MRVINVVYMARRRRTKRIVRYMKKASRKGRASAFTKLKPMFIGLAKSQAIDSLFPLVPGVGNNPMVKSAAKIGIGVIGGSKLGGGNNYVMYDGVKEFVGPFLQSALGNIASGFTGGSQAQGSATY